MLDPALADGVMETDAQAFETPVERVSEDVTGTVSAVLDPQSENVRLSFEERIDAAESFEQLKNIWMDSLRSNASFSSFIDSLGIYTVDESLRLYTEDFHDENLEESKELVKGSLHEFHAFPFSKLKIPRSYKKILKKIEKNPSEKLKVRQLTQHFFRNLYFGDFETLNDDVQDLLDYLHTFYKTEKKVSDKDLFYELALYDANRRSDVSTYSLEFMQDILEKNSVSDVQIKFNYLKSVPDTQFHFDYKAFKNRSLADLQAIVSNLDLSNDDYAIPIPKEELQKPLQYYIDLFRTFFPNHQVSFQVLGFFARECEKFLPFLDFLTEDQKQVMQQELQQRIEADFLKFKHSFQIDSKNKDVLFSKSDYMGEVWLPADQLYDEEYIRAYFEQSLLYQTVMRKYLEEITQSSEIKKAA